MNKNDNIIINPNKWFIIVLFSVAIYCLFAYKMELAGILPRLTGRPTATALLAACIIALCMELRTICLSKEILYIRYHILFIKRKIIRERVKSVEIVHKDTKVFLIISIDNCPSFAESGVSVSAYMFLHLIKAIVIQIPENKVESINKIKQFYPETVCVTARKKEDDSAT